MPTWNFQTFPKIHIVNLSFLRKIGGCYSFRYTTDCFEDNYNYKLVQNSKGWKFWVKITAIGRINVDYYSNRNTRSYQKQKQKKNHTDVEGQKCTFQKYYSQRKKCVVFSSYLFYKFWKFLICIITYATLITTTSGT